MATSEPIRGSEWRKWDLHFHSPASYDYRDKGTTYKDLAKVINASDIDAIAITDHWTFDGYHALKSLISSDKLVLPGIEMRLDKTSKPKGGTGTGLLHALVVFPEDTSKDDLERKFLHQIKLCEEDGRFLSKAELVKKGEEIKGKHGLTEEEYYAAGCEQAYVDYKEVCRAAHALGGIVCLTYDKYGGFEKIDPVNDSAFKSNLVKDADLIETGSEEVRTAFFENEAILKACEKRTPCFKGSDAHSPTEVGRDFTWIKADLSFEGLKQVRYFPKERISFSKTKPVYSYPRITSVRFKGLKKGHCLSSLKSEVNLSDNLTAVIGHPSIGKSTFSEVTAFLFDEHTTDGHGEEQTRIENLEEKNPSLVVEADVMRGDVKNTIKRSLSGEWDGDISADEFEVTYLNQGYIDRTARNPDAVSELVTERMDTLALDGIETNIKTSKGKLKKLREAYLGKFLLEARQVEINGKLSGVKKFFDISKSPAYAALDVRRKALADKERELNKVKNDLEALKASLEGYESELELNEFETSDIKKSFPSLSTLKISSGKQILRPHIDAIEDALKKIGESKEYKELATAKEAVNTETQHLFEKEGITYTKGVLQKKQGEQTTLEEQFASIGGDIQKAEKALTDFAAEVTVLTIKEEEWKTLNDALVTDFNTGLDKVQVVYEPADKEEWLIGVLTDEVKQAWDAHTVDKVQKFIKPSREDITKLITQIKEEHSTDIEGVISHLRTSLDKGKAPIKGNFEYVKWLFGSYSEVIKEFLKLRLQEFSERGKRQMYVEGKNISKEGLSFTERCGALLEVILEKGDNPIIVDQPEENLGSTYITKVLVPALLRKKFERQIVVISHNPNTVVLADSDLIVAMDRTSSAEDDIDLKQGAIEADGMKGTICEIIEGGAEAFDTRAQRYKKI